MLSESFLCNIHLLFSQESFVSQPYNSTDSMVALNNLILVSLLKFDSHITSILFIAYHAAPFLILMPLYVVSTHEPEYLKSYFPVDSTIACSILVPLAISISISSSMLYFMYFVLSALIPSPTFLHSLSTDNNNSFASSM